MQQSSGAHVPAKEICAGREASLDCMSRDESIESNDGLSMEASILPMSTSIPDMPTRFERPKAGRFDDDGDKVYEVLLCGCTKDDGEKADVVADAA